VITPADIRIAQHVIYNSGAADKFRDALTSDKRGRKPSFDQALFLLGMFLSARQHGKTHIRLIHKVLTEEVPIDQQVTWGIRKQTPNGDTWMLSEADLQNVSRSLKRALNYRAFLPKKHSGNEEEVARRKRLLEDLTDTLIDATLIPRPVNAHDYAIDESGIWASERATRRVPDEDTIIIEGDEEITPIPELPESTTDTDNSTTSRTRARRTASDAGYGVKTSKEGKRAFYYGYALHALVRVPLPNTDGVRPEPALVERIRLTPAGTDIVDVSLALIDSVRATKQSIRYLLADRHYSYKKIDRWLYRLIERGIEPVVQLREGDHGFREWDGMLFAAGHAHCPATPQHLGDIKQPPLDGTSEDWQQFHELIAEREAYAAQRTQKLQPNGSSRWRCPALNGTVGCPLRPGSVEAARHLQLPIVATPPTHPPSLCTQDSVGVKVETDEQAVIMKTHQKHYWGSRAQVTLNARRTYVEGWFGTLKGDSAAGKQRGSSLYTGLAHVTLEIAIFSSVANVIQLRAWHKETNLGDPSHPLLTNERPNHGYRYLTEDEYVLQLSNQETNTRVG
jgi:hypothetical protein